MWIDALKRKLKIRNRPPLTIHAERDSICMGDDCNAPNADELPYKEEEKLSHFLRTVASYIPVRRYVWAVYCDERLLALISFNALGESSFDLQVDDLTLTELSVSHIFCRHFIESDFSCRNADGAQVEKHPECHTLLEKVKAELSINEPLHHVQKKDL